MSTDLSEPAPPTVRRFFLGDDGLRAGWSLLLFLIVTFAVGSLVNALLLHFHLASQPAGNAPQQEITPRVTSLREGSSLFILAVSAWLTSRVERRPFRRYGTTLRRAVPDFVIGLVWGLVLLSALAGALWLTHTLVFDGFALHGSTAMLYACKWAGAFVLVGLFEEFLFRGYLQYTVARGVAGIARAMSVSSRHTYAIGFWVSAFLFSGLLFAITHLGNEGETVPGILAVALAGAVFAFSLWRTASLWWAIGFHTAWDWAQSFLYGTPDSALHAVGHLLNTHPAGRASLSGGSAGPEGSLLVLPTLILALGVIHFTLPFRPRFLTPDQMPPGESENNDKFAFPSSRHPS